MVFRYFCVIFNICNPQSGQGKQECRRENESFKRTRKWKRRINFNTKTSRQWLAINCHHHTKPPPSNGKKAASLVRSCFHLYFVSFHFIRFIFPVFLPLFRYGSLFIKLDFVKIQHQKCDCRILCSCGTWDWNGTVEQKYYRKTNKRSQNEIDNEKWF